MARALICDRCGDQQPETEAERSRWFGLKLHKMDNAASVSHAKELCQVCSNALLRWLQQPSPTPV